MAEDCPELIVMRQLASYLAMPIFVQDRDGNLVYFNEPAEPILGRRFDETGSLSRKELWELFRPTEPDGRKIDLEESPFLEAREDGGPVHRTFRLRGMDGITRQIEGTAIPLTTRSGRIVGSFAVFWEHDGASPPDA
jgi:PAS domain-containing protein